MLPNHWSFPIEERRFREGPCMPVGLEKVSSYYSKSEFRKNSTHFLECFVRNVLSTVAVRCLIGQGPICFCPEFFIRGDDSSALFLPGQLLDRLLESGTRVLIQEPTKAEFQSFVEGTKTTATAFREEAFSCGPYPVRLRLSG